jgi:hypothetical protein
MSEAQDHNIPSVRMDQSLSVLADVVASYVGQIKGLTDEVDLKKLHQLAISVFLHQLLMKSQHKEEMAKILDIIALSLREAA